MRITVQLQRRDGSAAAAIDLLSGASHDTQWVMPSLAPMLWRVVD